MSLNLSFSEKQQLIVTSAVASIAFAVLVAMIVVVFHFCRKFISAYDSVLLPPIAAIILAKVIQPFFDRLRKSLWGVMPARWRRTNGRGLHSFCTCAAITVILLILIVPVALLARFCGVIIWDQARELPGHIRDLAVGGWEKLPRLKEWLDSTGATERLRKIDFAHMLDWQMVLGKVKMPAVALLRSIPDFIATCAGWSLLPVYLALFLASRPFEGRDVSGVLLGVGEKTREHIGFLVDQFIGIVGKFFLGQVLIALVEAVLFGLGFHFLAHVHYGMILGLLVGIVGIVPYMGTIFVMPVVCLLAYFGADGGLVPLAKVFAVWGAIEVVEFFLTAKIQSDQVGLSNFAVIFSLVFWGAVLGGISGVFLAVPLTAFIVVFWRLLKREWLSAGVGREG